MIVIVSGAGAGQWRHIIANAGNTFTVDTPFQVVPAVGDHFTISYPTFENALIRNNVMSNNPLGVDLYHGAMLNVSVVNNTLANNGGIELVGTQRNLVRLRAGLRRSNGSFSVSRNIEINGNILTNTTGLFPAFIAVVFQLNTQTTFWGKSAHRSAKFATIRSPRGRERRSTASTKDTRTTHITRAAAPLCGTRARGP